MKTRGKAGYRAKKRNAHSRERRSTILIAAEGKNQTETQYFRDFAKEYGKLVRFVSGNYTDPVNMVNALATEYKKRELSPDYGDAGYCLVDSDFSPTKDPQIASADRIAADCGVHVLVSSPCFEIWFLCHYSASTRRYASYDEVRAELRKYHDGYEKNSVGMFEATKVKLSDAITNAERLKHACEENGYRLHTVEFAPSSEVGELAKKLTQS